MPSEIESEPQQFRMPLGRWARLWDVPQLAEDVTVAISSRFRSSLGSYRATRAEIKLAAWLIDGPRSILQEVLCHEAAHAAVHFRHGEGVKPHGQEWRDFMARAGVTARVRIPISELPTEQQQRLVSSSVWEHRCPICQAARLGRTRVTRWRCRRCREAGHSGELVIERVRRPIAVDA